MADDFNENDQVDLNSDTPAPSEVVDAGDDEIQQALDRIYNKATGQELEDAGITAEEAAKNAKHTRVKREQRKAEQKQELREEGLETDEEVDEEAIAKGEEDAPIAKDNDEIEDENAVDDEVAAAPALDPNLRYFASTALKWTDEKIDKLFKADPELATDTIQNLAATYKNLSQQLLQPQTSQVAPVTPAVEKPLAQPASPTSKLDHIYANLNEFAEANGEELTEFIKALKAEIIDPWRTEQAKIEARTNELSKTEARQTFGTLSTKFTDLYGEQGKARSPEQQTAVADLAEVADQLRAGAKARGQDLSVADAINRAHLLVSHEYTQQTVRKSIKEQVQKRAKGLSARPTQRSNPVLSSGKSREAAKDALTRKAADLGIAGFEQD